MGNRKKVIDYFEYFKDVYNFLHNGGQGMCHYIK
jgi:hypothetical protein